jgi:hypothetical protein
MVVVLTFAPKFEMETVATESILADLLAPSTISADII